MITFPCCKINLGLNVVNRRSDGYHDIETVFYPVPLCDALEVKLMDKDFPSDVDCDLLVKKNVDMIVANNLKVEGAGFGTDTNVVTLITADSCEELPIMSKDEVAKAIVDKAMNIKKD